MEKPKNVDEYIAQQRAAIAANPECGNSHYNLAVGLLGQRKFEEAEKALLEAIEHSPTLAEAYVQLGGICLSRGDLDGCLDYNTRATKTRAGFSEGYANIGFVKLQQGEIDDAIKNLQKAIAFNSNFIQAYTTLANAYLMQGLVDESIAANKKALSIEPEFPVAHNNLAIAYLEKGEGPKAVKHFDRAKELGFDVAPEIAQEIDAHR
jgi:tetratricopeptide (TPR) repeat protein